MADPIEQQVIDYTANYTGNPPESVNTATTLASIGITSGQDIINYLMELEDSFELIYGDGDEDGISTVGDVVALIKRKLGE